MMLGSVSFSQTQSLPPESRMWSLPKILPGLPASPITLSLKGMVIMILSLIEWMMLSGLSAIQSFNHIFNYYLRNTN